MDIATDVVPLLAMDALMTSMICRADGMSCGHALRQAPIMLLTAWGHSWGTCNSNQRMTDHSQV